MGILIFKGLTVRRLYKPFGIKGLPVASKNNIRLVYLHTSLNVHGVYKYVQRKETHN
jgi:hypothetical protein